jgi:HSP20 family molecular chaperone IbpA
VSFNPPPNAANAFNHVFGHSAEISPIGGHAGNSHFGFVNPMNVHARDPGYHVTTEVPGMRQGVPIPIRDYLSNFK